MTDTIIEELRFGTLPEITTEDKIQLAKDFAQKLVDNVKGYAYTMRASRASNGTVFVNVWVNGTTSNPGKFAFGKYATPAFFPNDGTDLAEIDNFLERVNATGLKYKTINPKEE